MKAESLYRLYANIGKIITSTLSLHKVIDGIMLEVQEYFAPEHWSLLRLDDNTGELFFTAIHGMDFDKVKDIRLKLGEGIAGQVAQEKISRYVPDTSQEEGFSSRVDNATGFKTKSIIAVPLIFQGKTYGVIEVVNKIDGSNFTPEEHLTLKTIADFAAIAFSNLQMVETLKEMAFTDALTGADNRAKLRLLLKKRSDIAEKDQRHHKLKFSVGIMLDLNFFKILNDRHGHRYGDEILTDFVRRLYSIVREGDHVIRMGGDEFLILIDCETEEEAGTIQNAMEKRLITLNLDCQNSEKPYSFSFGSDIGNYENLETLMQGADLKMYHNKKEDRSSTRTSS